MNFYHLAKIGTTDMRNAKDITDNARSIECNRASITAGANPLRNSAAPMLIAPSSIMGCLSEISSDAIHGYAHDYTAAMKSYGVVYAEYQSYLLPAEQMPTHDYDLAARPVADFSHLGCLNADLLDSIVLEDDISDDDIENCGYMAWVHH